GQLLAAALGVAAMVLSMRLGYRRLEGWAYPLLLLSLLFMILVLVPGIGQVAGGARRWIRVAGVGFQPAELAKLAIVVYLARSLARKREKVRDFSIGFVPHTLVVGLFALLLLGQPDFGSAVLLGALLFVMLFCAGAKISWLVASVLLSIPLLVHLIAAEEYRLRRFLAFLDPWKHRQDIGYQVAEPPLGVAPGEIRGRGLVAARKQLE